MTKKKRSRKDNLVGHILTPVSPKQTYFLGWPSATTKRKEAGGKTRVMATMYITGEPSMPAFWFPKGRIEASSLEEAILGFKQRFPKEKGWTHGRVQKLPSGVAAHLGLSVLRERREGD